MKTKVLLISGKAQSGKDYIADKFAAIAQNDGKNVLIIHFADVLKWFCEKHFNYKGVKDEQDRKILQYVGTDICRNNYKDTWVDIIIALVKGIKDIYDLILIPDARFPNEITKMCETFGKNNVKSLRIFRNFRSDLTETQQHHQSETALDDWTFDYILDNSGREETIVAIYKDFVENN